jgi:hypothetical protein
MAKSRGSLVGAIVVALACASAAYAQPAPAVLIPSPPGSVVQNLPAHLNGEATNGGWRAVTSKKLLGTANGQKFYQWYVSMYALRQGAYRLRYQSPRNGGPLSRVTQGQGSQMWFPVQDVRIAGVGELMRPGVQQVVVQSNEMAADCGSATVTVFASAPGGSAAPAVSVTNPCELSAAIGADKHSILLSGPYYTSSAPLCCPTKPHATAVLRYRDGRWTESPHYYQFRVGGLPSS